MAVNVNANEGSIGSGGLLCQDNGLAYVLLGTSLMAWKQGPCDVFFALRVYSQLEQHEGLVFCVRSSKSLTLLLETTMTLEKHDVAS